jgi:hypothetical protein
MSGRRASMPWTLPEIVAAPRKESSHESSNHQEAQGSDKRQDRYRRHQLMLGEPLEWASWKKVDAEETTGRSFR